MAKEYDRYGQTPWVWVDHPPAPETMPEGLEWSDDGWKAPQSIVLYTGSHVWVAACYAMEGHPEVKRVGDGRDNGYGDDGCCILSVPAAWCREFYTDSEVNDVMRAIDADERLLSYAR